MSFSFNINDKVLVRKTHTDIWVLGTYKEGYVELSTGGFTIKLSTSGIDIGNIYPYNLEYKYLLNTNKTPHIFKKGDIVLVRDYRNCYWEIGLYSSIGYEDNKSITYGIYKIDESNEVVTEYYSFCIPFIGNEHLAYTKDEPDNYDFRTNTITSNKVEEVREGYPGSGNWENSSH